MPRLTTFGSTWSDGPAPRRALGEPSRSFLNREISRNNFELLPISLDHATSVEDLAQHHKDPFDRLIVSAARALDATLITRDATIAESGLVRAVW